MPSQFNPDEVCQLTVNGRNFTTWETVWVQERWGEAFSYFRFTSNEDPHLPASWQDLQVKPCDPCTVSLGGDLAITGTVITRQTAYDANTHLVQIIGKSSTFWAFKSSIMHDTNNFDGKTFQQIATEILKPFPEVQVKVIGTVNSNPIKHVQIQKGEKIWDALERLARNNNCHMGSDRRGNALIIGDHVGNVVGSVIEGQNIKNMQATITVENLFTEINIEGQNQGSDDNNGTAAAQQSAKAGGTGCLKSVTLIPMEQPVSSQAELQRRADYEAKWTEGSKITANVTVQGWKTGGKLWTAGDDVMVKSPMAMIGQVMKIRTVTWTQDDRRGTETVLECVDPKSLNDSLGINIG